MEVRDSYAILNCVLDVKANLTSLRNYTKKNNRPKKEIIYLLIDQSLRYLSELETYRENERSKNIMAKKTKTKKAATKTAKPSTKKGC